MSIDNTANINGYKKMNSPDVMAEIAETDYLLGVKNGAITVYINKNFEYRPVKLFSQTNVTVDLEPHDKEVVHIVQPNGSSTFGTCRPVWFWL